MAIKQITATVAFTDPQNITLASGSLAFDLSQPATVTAGGGDVVPTRVILPLDSSGKIANQPVNLWANDQLTPSGTTYRMRVFNSNGLLVADWGPLSIIGASPIDLSQLTPVLSGGGTGSIPAVVLLNPVALQTITGFPLAAPAFQSPTANPASAGFIRMATSDTINWRNAANNGDISLSHNASDIIKTNFFGATQFISSSSTPSVTGVVALATGDSVNWRNNANNADISLAKNSNDSLTYNSFVIPQTVAQVNLTAQTASIGNTTLYAVPANGAGIYRMNWDFITTTAGAAGTVMATLGWNNGAAAGKSRNSLTTSLAGLGNELESDSGSTNSQSVWAFFSAASQNIQFSTTVTGGAGSQYSFRMRLEYLG